MSAQNRGGRRHSRYSSDLSLGDQILVRGHDLTDLIGEVSFTAAMLLDIDVVMPEGRRVRVVDAILVALMEHGITRSTLAGRLILDGAPESMQGAVAGGLLATGDRFLGTVSQAADAARRVVRRADDGPLPPAAAAVVDEFLSSPGILPGVGHNIHRDVDPRVQRLLGVTREASSTVATARRSWRWPRPSVSARAARSSRMPQG